MWQVAVTSVRLGIGNSIFIRWQLCFRAQFARSDCYALLATLPVVVATQIVSSSCVRYMQLPQQGSPFSLSYHRHHHHHTYPSCPTCPTTFCPTLRIVSNRLRSSTMVATSLLQPTPRRARSSTSRSELPLHAPVPRRAHPRLPGLYHRRPTLHAPVPLLNSLPVPLSAPTPRTALTASMNNVSLAPTSVAKPAVQERTLVQPPVPPVPTASYVEPSTLSFLAHLDPANRAELGLRHLSYACTSFDAPPYSGTQKEKETELLPPLETHDVRPKSPAPRPREVTPQTLPSSPIPRSHARNPLARLLLATDRGRNAPWTATPPPLVSTGSQYGS